MALNFLTKDQKKYYGKYQGESNEVKLNKFFHLDATGLELINNRRGDSNRVGFAILLTSIRFLGTFINDVIHEFPTNVHVYICQQLEITNLSVLTDYSSRETTRKEHMALIRKHYDYNDFHESVYWLKLSRLLFSRSWLNNERHGLLFDFARCNHFG